MWFGHIKLYKIFFFNDVGIFLINKHFFLACSKNYHSKILAPLSPPLKPFLNKLILVIWCFSVALDTTARYVEGGGAGRELLVLSLLSRKPRTDRPSVVAQLSRGFHSPGDKWDLERGSQLQFQVLVLCAKGLTMDRSPWLWHIRCGDKKTI